MLLASDIGACARRELVRHGGHDRAQPARRVGFDVQCQWWLACSASIEPAVAGLDTSAAFGTGIRVRHVENLLVEILNLLCGTSAAVPERSSQSRRRTSCTAAAVLLAEWRARATAMAAAAAGAAGDAAGCTAVVATCSSCPAVVLPIPHMHAQHAHARAHVHVLGAGMVPLNWFHAPGDGVEVKTVLNSRCRYLLSRVTAHYHAYNVPDTRPHGTPMIVSRLRLLSSTNCAMAGTDASCYQGHRPDREQAQEETCGEP